MKRKIILLTLSLLLFSSCIVKSIQPFYIKEAIKFDKNLLGNWTDNKKGSWEIASFSDEWNKENKPNGKLTKEDLDIYERYKNSYYVKYSEKETKAIFIATPFKVDKHLFIDLKPNTIEAKNLNLSLIHI